MAKELNSNKMQVLISNSVLGDVVKLAKIEERSISSMLRRLVLQGLHTYERGGGDE